MHLEQTVHINRPPTEVFDFLLDLSNHPRVAAGIKAVRGIDDGPLRLGRRYGQTSTFLGQTVDATVEVIACERPRKLGLKTVTGLVPITRTFRLAAPNAGETELTLSVDAELGKGMRLMQPMVERTAREQIASTLERLKSVLEAEGAEQPAR
jgi:carbon monoxide dehydrogenase subunit G